MSNKHIFITGGCGFVGTNLAMRLKEKYPGYRLTVFDNLKRQGSELNVDKLKALDVQYIKGDVRRKEDLVMKEPIDIIIDAAAETSIMAGMDSPVDELIQTNFNGTINALDLSVAHKAKFIFLSTSRVYPIKYLENINIQTIDGRFEIGEEQSITGVTAKGISESFPLDSARSFYGSSKLMSELMIEEYRAHLEVDYVINRCGVISGALQMGKVDQGVIALWMARHFWKQDIHYFGYGGAGKQVRDVMHVEDLFNLVDHQIHHFEEVNGQTFNAGGGIDCSISLKELTAKCADITGNKVPEHAVLENRKGDVPIYITDNTLIEKATNWKVSRTVDEVLLDIFEWLKQREKLLKPYFV